MTEATDERASQQGSTPKQGQQVWASANAAWLEFAQQRWAISRRTFYNYVGTARDCRPRRDGRYYADDIVKISIAAGWAPRTHAGLSPQGGAGGAKDVGKTLLEERLRRERIKGDLEEMELQKRRGELIPRGEMERQMAAGVAVLEAELHNWIHSDALEIIHRVSGDPKHEAELIDMLRERSRQFLNGFSIDRAYEIEVIDDDETSNLVPSRDAHAAD